jgi:hypothetical protein
MMNIDESNGIVKEAIFQNMTNIKQSMKQFDEFGFFQYTIFKEELGKILI